MADWVSIAIDGESISPPEHLEQEDINDAFEEFCFGVYHFLKEVSLEEAYAGADEILIKIQRNKEPFGE